MVSQQIAQRHGKVFDWQVKAKVMGQPALQAATIFVTELDIPQTPEVHFFIFVVLFPLSLFYRISSN